MPPFLPVAMKGGIRHKITAADPAGEKWGDLIWTRSNEIFLDLLSNVLMQNDDWGKEAVAIGLIGNGKREKDEKRAI